MLYIYIYTKYTGPWSDFVVGSFYPVKGISVICMLVVDESWCDVIE